MGQMSYANMLMVPPPTDLKTFHSRFNVQIAQKTETKPVTADGYSDTKFVVESHQLLPATDRMLVRNQFGQRLSKNNISDVELNSRLEGGKFSLLTVLQRHQVVTEVTAADSDLQVQTF